MSPAATLRHKAVDRAVGRAAKARNRLGLTPSIWMNSPFTLIEPASSRWTAATPRSRLIRPVRLDVSVVGATTSRSAGRSRLSGATPAVCAATVRTTCTLALDWAEAGSRMLAAVGHFEPFLPRRACANARSADVLAEAVVPDPGAPDTAEPDAVAASRPTGAGHQERATRPA